MLRADDVVPLAQYIIEVGIAQDVQILRRQAEVRFGGVDSGDVTQDERIVKRRFRPALSFVVQKVKTLFPPNGSSHRTSELVLLERLVAGLEDAAGIQRVVAEEAVKRAVCLVSAALRDDIHDAAHGATEHCAVLRIDDAEFLHCLLGRSRLLNSGCGRDVIRAIDSHEVVVNILAGKGDLRYRLDDHVG